MGVFALKRYYLTVSFVVCFFFLGFLFIFLSEQRPLIAKDIGALPLLHASAVKSINGLVKISSKSTVPVPLIPPKTKENKPVLYYLHTVEHYVEQDGVGGNDNSATVVSTPLSTKGGGGKWIEVQRDEEWASFTLGEVVVKPQNASVYLDLVTVFSEEGASVISSHDKREEVNNSDLKDAEDVSKNFVNGRVLKMRETVKVLPLGESLLVIGFLNNGRIDSGSPYIITNFTEEQLLAQIAPLERNFFYWLQKALAWFFLCLCFAGSFFLFWKRYHHYPFVDQLFGKLLIIVSSLFSLLLLLMTIRFVKYLLLIVIFSFVGVFIILLLSSRGPLIKDIGVHDD